MFTGEFNPHPVVQEFEEVGRVSAKLIITRGDVGGQLVEVGRLEGFERLAEVLCSLLPITRRKRHPRALPQGQQVTQQVGPANRVGGFNSRELERRAGSIFGLDALAFGPVGLHGFA